MFYTQGGYFNCLITLQCSAPCFCGWHVIYSTFDRSNNRFQWIRLCGGGYKPEQVVLFYLISLDSRCGAGCFCVRLTKLWSFYCFVDELKLFIGSNRARLSLLAVRWHLNEHYFLMRYCLVYCKKWLYLLSIRIRPWCVAIEVLSSNFMWYSLLCCTRWF